MSFTLCRFILFVALLTFCRLTLCRLTLCRLTLCRLTLCRWIDYLEQQWGKLLQSLHDPSRYMHVLYLYMHSVVQFSMDNPEIFAKKMRKFREKIRNLLKKCNFFSKIHQKHKILRKQDAYSEKMFAKKFSQKYFRKISLRFRIFRFIHFRKKCEMSQIKVG